MSFCKHRIMDEAKDYPPYLDYPKPSKSQTNADRIRSMSDEELADFLEGINACSNCAKRWNSCFPHWDALEWLQQPAKEADNETVGERKDGYGNG